MSMVAKLQESLQATVTLHQKATKDSNQINMLSVSLADPHRVDADQDPDFHVDADPDPDPDWHQNNAHPHADPSVSFTHVGKKIFFTFCHSIATLCILFLISVKCVISFQYFEQHI